MSGERIFSNKDENVLTFKKIFLEKKKKIEEEYTITKKEIEENKKRQEQMREKTKIMHVIKNLKNIWEKDLLAVPFFRELLKNIEFCIEDSNLLSKLEIY